MSQLPGRDTLALSCLVLLLLIILKRRYLTSIRDIPGPFLASFSSLWQVQQLFKGHTEEVMVKLHRRHGDLVRIGDNEVSVAHPDAIKQLLHANLVKGKWYSIFSLPDSTFVNQMSELRPHRHIAKSRNVSAGYSLSNIIKSEPYVDRLIAQFATRLDTFSNDATPIELDKWFNYYAFDVLGEVTFSKSFNFLLEGRDIRNAIANTRALAIYVAVMGHYAWFHFLTLGNPLLSRLGVQPSSHIFDTTLAAIEERKSNPDVRKDMMEQWLSVRRTHPDRMEESEVFGAAVANVGAGADTVSSSLQAFFYYLIRNPMYLERLRGEIDEAQEKGELSRVVAYAEARKLTYLDACVKETYRFHPATGTGMPRVVPEGGLTVAGRHFAAGTVLSVNPWVFHRNPALFGADCDLFNPDRWLDKDRYHAMEHYLIHWGAGYNQCPGKHLAHFEILKLVATLLRDYDFSQVEPAKAWTFETHFTIVPYGWPCWVKKRRSDVHDEKEGSTMAQ